MASNFTVLENSHRDIILAVDFNFYGTRMATASADHRVKVYDRKDDTWSTVDTFTAHDAEVTDIKWNGPFNGEIFGTIAEDGRFKLWQEDVTEMPNQGRRFQCIMRMSSDTRVPFMSLDFKNIIAETYVALITRDGYLKVLEPYDHEDLAGQWHVLHERYITPTASRSEETSYKVSFHKEKLPCWNAVRAGLDRKALSLAVACMKSVKIYRTDREKRFYQVAKLTEARDLVRDVAWANGAMRGWDIIATASKDGCLRIYELRADESGSNEGFGTSSLVDSVEKLQVASPMVAPTPHAGRARGTVTSGLSAGLANSSAAPERAKKEEDAPGRIKESCAMVEEINLHRGAIWKVAFSQMGDVLASTGDDGTVRTWKKAIDGKWHEYAEIDIAED